LNTNLRPNKSKAIFFIRSVVPNPRFRLRSPEIVHHGTTYVHRIRTSIERIRRWQTYVDRIRAWIRTSPEDAYVGRTHTSETRTCIVEICSRDMRTSSDHVRQANTYAGGRRTSAEYVRASQHRRICTHGCRSPRMRTPNLHLHGRSWNPIYSLRRQTNLETFT